jgi:hypothetical protein
MIEPGPREAQTSASSTTGALPAGIAGWHISHRGKHYGPYRWDVLLGWHARGQIPHDASISLGDRGPWLPVLETLAGPEPDAALVSSPGQMPPKIPSGTATGVTASSSGQAEAETLGPPPGAIPTAASAGVRPSDRDDAAPERDRIVVLGRRQSGKTIYLATIYAQLWRSLDGLTAKALSGEAHRQLMSSYHLLQQGQWPPSTLGTTQVELEIEHRGRKSLLVTLDFAGELFRKAFVDERHDWPGVAELVRHIDRAAAVLLLVDPSVVAGLDHDAAMDDDFGLVQAVQRIRNWPGGDDVPVALVLTKIDTHQGLIDRFGGTKGFVRHHFPALVRLLRQVPIFQVSAVQTELVGGKSAPRRDFVPVNVDAPLRFCLGRVGLAEERRETDRRETERVQRAMRVAREERERERSQNRRLMVAIAAILIAGIGAVVWILVKQF